MWKPRSSKYALRKSRPDQDVIKVRTTTGAGNVRIPAILTAVGAAMTLCLSPLLIFGCGPFPRFGVAGAGLAMIAYYVIATAALIAYLRSPHTPIRLVRTRIRWRLMKDILGVGT
jgi:Na+-driven multidrug efflux pump